MKVLITGGTGLIGSALIRSLLAGGHQVTNLSRKPARASSITGLETVLWDGVTTSGWGQLVNKMDAVVNLAGENIGSFPWSETRKQKFRDSRIRAGKALVAAIEAAEQKPKVFIQASAVGFYGSRGDERFDETAGAGEDFSARLCVDWEASTQAIEHMGVRRVVIRTGIVLARDSGSLPLMALPVKLFAGGPIGSGRQGMPWIHIADEVGAIQYLMENEQAEGVFNLSAPDPISNAEFVRALAKALHRPYWLPAPAFAIKLLLGEMSSLLLDSLYMVPRRLLEHGYKFKYPEIEAALANLYSR